MKVKFNMYVEKADLKRWRESARALRMSVAAWVRLQCMHDLPILRNGNKVKNGR